MISPEAIVGLSIQGVVGLATVVGAYYTLQHAVADATRDATKALEVSAAAHRRVDDHERRLSAAERDLVNQGRNLELALARLEGQVSALSARFDSLLLRLTVRGNEGPQ